MIPTKHRRGRTPGSRTQSHMRTHSFHAHEDEESEEDDVLIVADGPSSRPSKKARAGARTTTSIGSDEAMDVDMDISPDSGKYPSSSTYTTTPALSQTIASPMEASPPSLPLPGLAGIISRTPDSHSFAHSPSTSGPAPWLPAYAVSSTPGSPLPVSREEKAVAALSLALADGAGLNDYQEVREVQEKLGGGSEADFQVGDLWH